MQDLSISSDSSWLFLFASRKHFDWDIKLCRSRFTDTAAYYRQSLCLSLSSLPPIHDDYSLRGKYKHLYTIKCAVYFDVWFSASVSDAPRLALSGLASACALSVLGPHLCCQKLRIRRIKSTMEHGSSSREIAAADAVDAKVKGKNKNKL